MSHLSPSFFDQHLQERTKHERVLSRVKDEHTIENTVEIKSDRRSKQKCMLDPLHATHSRQPRHGLGYMCGIQGARHTQS
jgi:enterochelin esterase-like enzyme